MLFKECYLSTYSLTDHVYISVSSRAYVRRFVPVIVFKLKKKETSYWTVHLDMPNSLFLYLSLRPSKQTPFRAASPGHAPNLGDVH